MSAPETVDSEALAATEVVAGFISTQQRAALQVAIIVALRARDERAAAIADAESEKEGIAMMRGDKANDEWSVRHFNGGRTAAARIAAAIRARP